MQKQNPALSYRLEDVAVIEVPIDHEPSVDCLGAILQRTKLRVTLQINLDL